MTFKLLTDCSRALYWFTGPHQLMMLFVTVVMNLWHWPWNAASFCFSYMDRCCGTQQHSLNRSLIPVLSLAWAHQGSFGLWLTMKKNWKNRLENPNGSQHCLWSRDLFVCLQCQSHFLMHRRLCMNVERRQVKENEQHRKHMKRTARWPHNFLFKTSSL